MRFIACECYFFIRKKKMGSFNFQISNAKTSSGLLMLPLGLLRLLKPCKVKRFLATEDLSVVGLVTGSSGNNGLKCRGVGVRKEEEGKKEVERQKEEP